MSRKSPSFSARTLTLTRLDPNPQGMPEAELFAFTGNASVGPLREIVGGDGVPLDALRAMSPNPGSRLKVIHFNDLHGHVARFTPASDWPIFSRIVARLREIRNHYENRPDVAVLALSAGDDLVGSVFDEMLDEVPEPEACHVGYRLYSAGGIDASVLGNHDLDLGESTLAHAIRKDARFPLLSANLVGSEDLQGLYYPAILFVTKGIRIGIVGLTTRGQFRQPPNSNLQLIDPLRTAHNILPAIRPFCDIIIILSHLGYSLATHSAIVRDTGDIELARSLPPNSADLIIGGHTHHVLNEQGLTANNIVNGIPIVQAGTLGNFIGEVDLKIEAHTATVTNVRLTRSADLPVDMEFEHEEVRPIMDMARPFLARSLGQLADHPDLSTDAVRNSFSAGESALANFITDALVERCRIGGYEVDLAMIDAPSVRCGLPRSEELTFGDWFNMMPFADTLFLCWMTGNQLKVFLEDNAYRIDRPGEPHTERGFVHFSKRVNYTIKLGENRQSARACDMTVDGIPIENQPERSFLIVCSSFLREMARPWQRYATQNLSIPLLDIREIVQLDTTLFLRDELVDFIRDNGGVIEDSGARRDGRCIVVP